MSVSDEVLRVIPAGRSDRPALGRGVYSTTFDNEESPISGAGVWSKVPSGWKDVVVSVDGLCYGTNGAENTYDDAFSVLAGDWSGDYSMHATVVRSASLTASVVHEIELNGRGIQTATTIRGIECLFNRGGSCEMYEWYPAPYSDPGSRFSGLKGSGAKGSSLISGDVIKVRYSGTNVKAYVNSIEIASASFTITTGRPWIGFFTRPGGNTAHLAITDLTITPI